MSSSLVTRGLFFMLIRRIFYPLKTLGPGERIGIWTMGCTHACFNCMTEDLQVFDQRYQKPVPDVISMIQSIQKQHPHLQGITISGGEPFQQSELPLLLKGLRELGFKDILVYSGYTMQEIKNLPRYAQEALELIGVLIDGRYVEALNDDLPLRGSSNQIIHFLDHSLQSIYDPIINQGFRPFEIAATQESFSIYGILPKRAMKKLSSISNKLPKG